MKHMNQHPLLQIEPFFNKISKSMKVDEFQTLHMHNLLD